MSEDERAKGRIRKIDEDPEVFAERELDYEKSKTNKRVMEEVW